MGVRLRQVSLYLFGSFLFPYKIFLLLLDVRAKRGADVASDHHLVIGEVKIKLSTRRQPRPTRWHYEVDKLKDGYNKQCFELALSNRYASLV